MRALPKPLAGVLFDLDGTLVDSAPDLYAALVRQCAEEGVVAPGYERVRDVVSRGARAVLRRGFADADASAIEARVDRFLALYKDVMAEQTRPFEGIEPLLRMLELRGVSWGIVTNKAEFLTRPLLHRLELHARAAAVVCGDTLAQRKPDPAPVLHACRQVGATPTACVFVGDDARDIEAGRAAGLFTVAAAWGYLDGGDPRGWGADAVVETVAELTTLLRDEVAGA